MTDRHRIAVFGAGGHTGRFVVSELLRRDLDPIVIGRDAERLAAAGLPDGVEARIATVDDPASLDRALQGAVAVINCAGPFLETAEAVTAAALRARIHYLDVTAEQMSALHAFERFDAAKDAGVVVMPAMSFYGGLADLLATAAMGDWASADEIRIGIALDSWRPTLGTRLTGQRNTAPRLIVSDGRLTPLPLPAHETSWTFPEPFGVQEVVELPFSETILISRHLRSPELRTHLNLAPLRDLRDSATPPPTSADDAGRSDQTFLVEAIVRQGTVERRATASGRDIYAVTAPLVVEAVRRVLAGASKPGALEPGVWAPGEAFDASEFLHALAPEPLTVEIRAG